MKEIFTEIYSHNLWGGTESVSGPGSSLRESLNLINKLPLLFNLFDIRSILDAPCGDFHWMKHVHLEDRDYTGVDIVKELIEKNTSLYEKEHISFAEKNIIHDSLPKADLILCRDALVHLTNEQVKETIRNFQDSGSTYLLTTHFPGLEQNRDISAGDWRPLNLCLEPFQLPEPFLTIKETTTIKTMALWRLKDLNA